MMHISTISRHVNRSAAAREGVPKRPAKLILDYCFLWFSSSSFGFPRKLIRYKPEIIQIELHFNQIKGGEVLVSIVHIT